MLLLRGDREHVVQWGYTASGVPSEGSDLPTGMTTLICSIKEKLLCSAGKYSGISRAYGSDDYSDREDSKSISGVSAEKIKPILFRKMSESYKEQKRCFV